ncbi:MAG: hypothetical protein Q9195_002747 [Heterodermia aff. obscurata]
MAQKKPAKDKSTSVLANSNKALEEQNNSSDKFMDLLIKDLESRCSDIEENALRESDKAFLNIRDNILKESHEEFLDMREIAFKTISSLGEELDSIIKKPKSETIMKRPKSETMLEIDHVLHRLKAKIAIHHEFVLAMVLAIVYLNVPQPKMIDAIKFSASDIEELEHLIKCTLVYHLLSTLVAGSDRYPLWPRRHEYLARRFRICVGLYIALRCCLGGHRLILIALAGYLFNYLDGYWTCYRQKNELITDAPPTDTDAHTTGRESAKSACGGNNELVAESSLTGTDTHNAPHESVKSGCGENDGLVLDALLPGTDAYNVLAESVRSACMKENEWIIDAYKTGLDSVRSCYAKLFEELKQDSVQVIKEAYDDYCEDKITSRKQINDLMIDRRQETKDENQIRDIRTQIAGLEEKYNTLVREKVRPLNSRWRSIRGARTSDGGLTRLLLSRKNESEIVG